MSAVWFVRLHLSSTTYANTKGSQIREDVGYLEHDLLNRVFESRLVCKKRSRKVQIVCGLRQGSDD